ncbi:MAG: ComEA family DNA-binding protein [Bacteroidia bacterium]
MSTQQGLSDFFNKKSYRKKKVVHSSFRSFLRHYFTFHKDGRNGTILVLALILFFTVLTLSYRFHKSQTVPDTSEFQKELNAFIAGTEQKQQEDSSQKFIADAIASPSQVASQLFVFNPNSATEEDFVKLGLTQKQAMGIINYRNKGGKFRKKEDFAKMYTVSKELYERLEAFIAIPEELPKENFYADNKPVFEKKEYPPKQTVLVEINTADSLDLIKIKGIGPYISMKIIEYRTKLGGFYSKEQLREVYKIDSVRYREIEPFLTVDPFEVKKLNINTATVDELKNHPYIRYNIANSIVSIRQQHGRFKEIKAIMKSHLVTEDVFRKIAPYLTIE